MLFKIDRITPISNFLEVFVLPFLDETIQYNSYPSLIALQMAPH